MTVIRRMTAITSERSTLPTAGIKLAHECLFCKPLCATQSDSFRQSLYGAMFADRIALVR
jgi:hypothetical protein